MPHSYSNSKGDYNILSPILIKVSFNSIVSNVPHLYLHPNPYNSCLKKIIIIFFCRICRRCYGQKNPPYLKTPLLLCVLYKHDENLTFWRGVLVLSIITRRRRFSYPTRKTWCSPWARKPPSSYLIYLRI